MLMIRRMFLLSCVLVELSCPGELLLARRGNPAKYVIVRSEGASASEKYAAEELQKHFLSVTGVSLPIQTDEVACPEHAIVLGNTRVAQQPADSMTLGMDGFHLQAKGKRLFVWGSGKRGVLYGVYEMLERYAGCRWYSSWHSVIPAKDRICVPDDLDDRQEPAFAMRQPFWYDVMVHNDFAARLRVNGYNHVEGMIEEKFGGDSFRFGGGLPSCHTFNVLMPPDEFFERHPEYYSFEQGRRVKYPSQLCLTNPDVLRIVTERVLERIRKDPGAWCYGVSQNDWDHHCQCPSCKTIDEEEGSPSGTMVRFVNAVAEAVEKEFPNVFIETLAYQYTRKPPKKTRLRHNVIPCLCTIECDFSHPLNASCFGENVGFCRDIRGWSRLTDQLYVWDYTTDFPNYAMPFANVRSLQGNLKFFRDNGVKEIFEQGAFNGRHGDFAELKAWLLAKWMWNPDLPAEPLLDEFFAAYYGKGAPFVRSYFNELHEAQASYSSKGSNPLIIWCGPENPALSDEFLDRSEKLWEQAALATRDDVRTSYNVRMGAFSVEYAQLERLRLKGNKVLWLSSRPVDRGLCGRRLSLARRLLAKMDEAGDIRLAESMCRHDGIVKEWRKIVESGQTIAPADLSYGELEDSYIDGLGLGKWCDYVDDPTADDGRALKICNLHFEWCGQFPMSRVEFEPGVEYTLRVRVKCETAGAGEAFYAGVYDSKRRQPCAEIRRRTDQVGSGYEWHDVCTWTPNGDEYFWIGPGRFDRGRESAVKTVWVDKIAFVRKL